jgi:hypothetical protein
MKIEKVKRKIIEGYPNETIANMSGMTIEDIQKLRNPPKPKAQVRKTVAPIKTTAKGPTTKK